MNCFSISVRNISYMGFVLFENSSYCSYKNKNNVRNISFMDPVFSFSFPFLLKILKLLHLDLFSENYFT